MSETSHVRTLYQSTQIKINLTSKKINFCLRINHFVAFSILDRVKSFCVIHATQHIMREATCWVVIVMETEPRCDCESEWFVYVSPAIGRQSTRTAQ